MKGLNVQDVGRSAMVRRGSSGGLRRAGVVLGVLSGVALSGAAWGQAEGGRDAGGLTPELLVEMSRFGERAVVKPSRDAVMGFNLSTSVKEILVSGGRRVASGDLLVRGDDSEDIAEAEFQRARAETELPLERARVQMELAEIEYERQLSTFNEGAGSQMELDRARVARDTARIDYELGLLNQVLSDLQATRAEARAAKLSLRAPFDGLVDVVHVDVGQSVREGDPVVRVVSVDPLWIDVPAPTSLTMALGLAPGGPAWVLLQEDVAERVYTARVIEVAPTADASSRTRRVRVEMDNAIGLVAGVNCWVRFTEPEGRWAEVVVDPSVSLPDTASGGASDALAEGRR
jgi:RND family efflux transporter MFP subunit